MDGATTASERGTDSREAPRVNETDELATADPTASGSEPRPMAAPGSEIGAAAMYGAPEGDHPSVLLSSAPSGTGDDTLVDAEMVSRNAEETQAESVEAPPSASHAGERFLEPEGSDGKKEKGSEANQDNSDPLPVESGAGDGVLNDPDSAMVGVDESVNEEETTEESGLVRRMLPPTPDWGSADEVVIDNDGNYSRETKTPRTAMAEEMSATRAAELVPPPLHWVRRGISEVGSRTNSQRELLALSDRDDMEALSEAMWEEEHLEGWHAEHQGQLASYRNKVAKGQHPKFVSETPEYFATVAHCIMVNEIEARRSEVNLRPVSFCSSSREQCGIAHAMCVDQAEINKRVLLHGCSGATKYNPLPFTDDRFSGNACKEAFGDADDMVNRTRFLDMQRRSTVLKQNQPRDFYVRWTRYLGKVLSPSATQARINLGLEADGMPVDAPDCMCWTGAEKK